MIVGELAFVDGKSNIAEVFVYRRTEDFKIPLLDAGDTLFRVVPTLFIR
jgi:hypothetical protein